MQVKRVKPWLAVAGAGVVLAGLAAGIWFGGIQQHVAGAQPLGGGVGLPAPASAVGRGDADSAQRDQAMAPLREVLANYRKIIVLLADEAKLGAAEKAAANQAGMALFHANIAKAKELVALLEEGPLAAPRVRLQVLPALLDYVESDPELFDADRLAFREVLRQWQATMARDGTLPAIKLHKRIGEDLDALAEIERNYEKEIREVFGRFESRGITLKRERWDDYVAQLQRLYPREAILRDHGVVLPYPEPAATAAANDKGKGKARNAVGGTESAEFSGRDLPPKTIVLTFDDGPHGTYTPEIAAILKQYDVPGVFFQVGSNLGTVGADGKPHLNARAQVSKQLQAAGHVLANHSLTHAQLSKRSGDALRDEILVTDKLLTSVDERRSVLFRFPYGARNAEGMDILSAAHLRSVMWNVDSLDWADPVPASIAQRVLSTLEKEGRGIILFHDIHERTVKALPGILSKLVADGYQFATWDGKAFVVPKGAPAAAAAAPAAAAAGGYSQSWAIVVGIDEYARWPRLQYAVRDARSVREALIQKFGFAAERIVTLENKEATRTNILAAFHDKLAHGGMQKNDRLFVFFAGHGATRKLTSGRDLGYIIPVDSDPQQFATDAIPMSELQNIAESVTAKHTLFVMDACYSGLGLTRGGGNGNFLRDNAKRVGRQMLTAGGADQLVADGGPNGHSVFTWALLQGLGGKGDLNGDGIITATELAAYVAPAVASASSQTPAFGSLPGSEGGDFVFELPTETEFLSAQSTQLGSEAIAMNTKLDAGKPAAVPASQSAASGAPSTAGPVPKVVAPVVVKDLQGNDQKITPPQAVTLSHRQLAQRANDRGLQLYREKQYEQAEAQFTEALKLRPDFALAANNLGFIYYRQDKFLEAARWFDNAIRMDPSRAVAYLNLGEAHEKAGDAERANKAYATYLELAPKGPTADKLRERLGQR
ncbi:MAG: polysaccharide deacetylase family protein [Acidovorax sp.]|nr:polysaccharide deacetylase family protein [Acidovorax sp.]